MSLGTEHLNDDDAEVRAFITDVLSVKLPLAKRLERLLVMWAFIHSGFSCTAAAELIGVSRPSYVRRIYKYVGYAYGVGLKSKRDQTRTGASQLTNRAK